MRKQNNLNKEKKSAYDNQWVSNQKSYSDKHSHHEKTNGK